MQAAITVWVASRGTPTPKHTRIPCSGVTGSSMVSAHSRESMALSVLPASRMLPNALAQPSASSSN